MVALGVFHFNARSYADKYKYRDHIRSFYVHFKFKQVQEVYQRIKQKFGTCSITEFFKNASSRSEDWVQD